jgi:acetylornithine deacetylase/succinyl-diaminopimelate desuccinylase-like protein
MSRLTLSDADKQARDWFVEMTKSLGCDVKVDAMGEFFSDIKNLKARAETMSGNIFAVRPGKKGGPPTYAGSHMDTQVSCSKFLEQKLTRHSLLEEDMMEYLAFTRVSKL